jgi:hypothetical protein
MLSLNKIYALQGVSEHVIYVEDAEQWYGEVYAGALNPGGPLQGPRLQAGLAHPAGPGRMCFLIPGEACIAGQGIIFKLSRDETVSYFAGSTEMTGFQDGSAAAALFGLELTICQDGKGGLYVSDRFNRCIRRIHPSSGDWIVTTLAGDHANPLSDHLLELVRNEDPGIRIPKAAYAARSTHDGRGREATFSYLHSNVVADKDGNLYVMDADFLRRISPTGQVKTLNPGGGSGNPGPDGELLESAHFRLLMKSGIGFGKDGHLYVADRWNHCVRRVDLQNRTVATLPIFHLQNTTLSTVIGPGRGYIDGPSSEAGFHDSPGHITLDPFRNRIHVNGVDDWGLRVWDGSSIKTLAGGKRGNRALEGPAPDLGFHWCGTHAIDPQEPHPVYFWSNQGEWRGRIGKLYRKEDSPKGLQ